MAVFAAAGLGPRTAGDKDLGATVVIGTRPVGHAWFVPTYPDPRDVVRLDKANKDRFARLFSDPEHAERILTSAVLANQASAQVSSIVLDNATVDYAFSYFNAERPQSVLPTQPDLVLAAVAEFVNAAVLYEQILTGPENSKSTKWRQDSDGTCSEVPLWRAATDVVSPVEARLSWPEIFAVLSLAKRHAVNSVDPTLLDTIGNLLGKPLDLDTVVDRLEAITPASSRHSAHHLYKVVNNDDYYYSDFSVGTLGPNQIALNAVDPGNAGRSFRDRHFHLIKHHYDAHIPAEYASEYFAAHLLYRTHVYLLLADLLGCPYSADALRSVLVQRLTSRHSWPGFAERVTQQVGDAERARDERVNELLGRAAFTVPIPLVLKHVLSRATRPADILAITMETRDSAPARRFRRYCTRVDEAIAAGRRDDVARACVELADYGIKLDAELTERAGQRTDLTAATDAAKQLISIPSPLLGALIPGLKLATSQANRWRKRRKFAFVEQLVHLPRNLNQVEQEFARLWAHL